MTHPHVPDAPVSLHGRFSSLVVVNLSAALFGALILALMLALRPGIGRSAFPILYGVFLLYLVADAVHWRRRGVHAIEVDGETLRVFRGREMRPEVVPLAEVSDVALERKFGRRHLQILLGDRVVRLPGIRLFPGRKVWITSDAFDDAEFDRFAAALLERRRALAGAAPLPDRS